MNMVQRLRHFALLVVTLAVASLWCSQTPAPARDEAKKNTKSPQQILIIRHGEKTGDEGDPHLSKRGKERAAVVDKLFVVSKDRPDPFPRPDFIFAARNSKGSHRPVETVTPLAMKLKLPINETYESKLPDAPPASGKEKTDSAPGMLALRDKLFSDPKYLGKTILVSWRHGSIPELAKTLKASKTPAKWGDEVFDRVWQITYDEQGHATFLDRPQRLIPGDSEK